MSIAITLIGHATLLLEIGEHRVVIDPFLAPHNPSTAVDADSLAADYILVTHAHNDHTADLLALARATGALVISNVEICNWMNRHDYKATHGMNTGGAHTFPFGRVKLTHALHSSGFPDGSAGGNPVGFLITTPDQTLYVAGDTALFSDMRLIGDHQIDVAVLPIGDNFTMGPDDALASLDYLRPSAVIPYHYGTWPVIAVDATAWAERVAATTKVKPVALAPGDRAEF